MTLGDQWVHFVEIETVSVAADPTWRELSVTCKFKDLRDISSSICDAYVGLLPLFLMECSERNKWTYCVNF